MSVSVACRRVDASGHCAVGPTAISLLSAHVRAGTCSHPLWTFFDPFRRRARTHFFTELCAFVIAFTIYSHPTCITRRASAYHPCAKNVGPHTPCHCTWHAAQLSCSNVHVLDGAAQHPPRGEHVCPHTLLEQTRKQAGTTAICIGPCRRRRPLRLTCHCDACRGWVCGTPSVRCYTTRTPPSRRGCLVMTRRGAPPPSTPRGWYFGATATANPTAH